MKILIVGTGVIGTIYGWALAGAGHEVRHIVRPSHLADGPIPLDLFDTRPGAVRRLRTTYRPARVLDTQVPDDADLVVVPTKTWQVVQALTELGPLTGSADYLITSGNWQGTTAIEAALGPDRFVIGDPIAGGGFTDGTLVASLSRRFVIGEPGGTRTPRLVRLEALFERASIGCEVPADVVHWHWLQYAINAGLLGALAAAGGFEDVAHAWSILDRGLFAVHEALDVCIRRGVQLERFPGPRRYYGVSWPKRKLAALGLRFQLRFNEAAKRNTAHALGNPGEVEAFYREVLATGRALEVPMPHYASFEHDVDRFVKHLADRR